jgi:hypothetical protein
MGTDSILAVIRDKEERSVNLRVDGIVDPVRRYWHGLSAAKKRTAVVIIGAVLGVIGLLAVAVCVPPHLVDTVGMGKSERLKAENDVRTTLVQTLGGTVLLLGLYFTARNISITREGQITDRFTKAIAQLGDGNLDVRLGGIYALERIAHESAKDHGPIMEVLTAFLREHAHRQPLLVEPPSKSESNAARVGPDAPPGLPADFQAIATVLGRRPEERRRDEGRALVLRDVDLCGADLVGAHLERVELRYAHLEKAILRYTHLEGAYLRDAHLEGANLRDAHMEKAILRDAHLEGADLRGALLKQANLIGAHLEGANLRDAHLEGANLAGAYLDGADLTGTHLDRVDLRDARASHQSS